MVWLWQRRDLLRPVEASLSQAALRESAFNELADLVRQSVDIERVRTIMGLDSEAVPKDTMSLNESLEGKNRVN